MSHLMEMALSIILNFDENSKYTWIIYLVIMLFVHIVLDMTLFFNASRITNNISMEFFSNLMKATQVIIWNPKCLKSEQQVQFCMSYRYIIIIQT